jgi:putative NADH-flavin reductase
MKLFLLGATGRTGKLVIEQALRRGHAVTAVVRQSSAGRFMPANAGLHVVVADPRDADTLAPSLAGHDAVISCLGQRSRQDATLLRDSADAIVTAMNRAGVRRFLVVSQGLLFPSRNPVVVLLRAMLRRHVVDTVAMERRVAASKLDWTIVRPPRLVDGGAARGYRVEIGSRPRHAWAIQYGDLAALLLDAAEKDRYRKTVVGVATRLADAGPRTGGG